MDQRKALAHLADRKWQDRLLRWESDCNEITNYTNVPGLAEGKRAELVSMIEETRRRLESAGPEAISREIAKLAMACKHGASDGSDRSAFVSIMTEHTLGYPIDIIREAAYEWIHTETFFPSIAEFCGLCEPRYQARRSAYETFKRALTASDRKHLEANAEAARLKEWKDPNKRAELERKVREAKAALQSETTLRRMEKRRFVHLPDEERERLLNKLSRA